MEEYKSEILKLIERGGFRRATPTEQIDIITTLNKMHPVKKEYREAPSNVKPIPIEQEMKNKEYKELIKLKNKLFKTA